jgi:glucose/arabinose dehydrogenase
MKSRLLVGACVAAALLTSCSDDLDRSGPGGISSQTAEAPSPEPTRTPDETGRGPDSVSIGDIKIGLRPVVTGLESPLLVTNADDGSDRLFIVEQTGRIRIARGNTLVDEPFLDISDLVTAGGEQGLLGLAFHPNYERNGRFYVNYTHSTGDHVVAEYRVSSDPDRADPSSARILMQFDDPFANHNGGHIAFGEDGYLYIAVGDGGAGGDPLESGQSLNTFLGKILRIDVDRGSSDREYGIPSDNPFVEKEGARPEIWAYGLRNPWRFSFDSGNLWIGDVGQDQLEEIDRMPGDRGGLNYGWNTMEGDGCFDPPSDCDRGGLVLPIGTYTHEDGCSVLRRLLLRFHMGDRCRGGIDSEPARRSRVESLNQLFRARREWRALPNRYL